MPRGAPLATTFGRLRTHLEGQARRVLRLELAALLAVLAPLLLIAVGLDRRALYVVLPIGLGLLVGLGLRHRRRRLGLEQDARIARLLGERLPESASGWQSAASLDQQLRADALPAGTSRELAQAHVDSMAAQGSSLDLPALFPATPVRRALRTFALALLALVALLFAGRAPLRLGFARLTEGEKGAQALAERLAEPITFDIALTLTPPAYTGLPVRSLQGTTGEVTALAGTEVRLETRADRAVVRAVIVLGDQQLPLEVANGRDLKGAFVVDGAGSYRFRFLDAVGSTAAEGPPIPIAVEPDRAPSVKLLAPAAEVEVDPKDQVELRFEAEDDFGMERLELVWRIGQRGPEQRKALPLEATSRRRLRTSHGWALSTLGLTAGDRVTYRVEARDGNTVKGAQTGRSREQVLKVFSEAEHHRMALELVEKLWQRMVSLLGDALEHPSERADATPEQLASEGAERKAVELAQAIADGADLLRRDKVAPKEIVTALGNIHPTLRKAATRLADTRITLARALKQQGTVEGAPRAKWKPADEGLIAELERDAIYLEKLLDHRRIEDLLALSKDLAAKRRELTSLMERFQKAPDDATRAAIEQELTRLKERIGELMRRMSELSRSISDEHLNEDALQEMKENESMVGKLDRIQQLMREGKVDEAMKLLQQLGDQMDKVAGNLEKARGGFDQRQDPELAKQFGEFTDKLGKAAEAQRQLERDAQKLRQEAHAKVEKRLAEKGEELSRVLREKVKRAANRIDDAARALDGPRYDQDAQEASEALVELDRALAAKAWDPALDMVQKAIDSTTRLAGQTKAEAQRSRRFSQFGAGAPEKLETAARHADSALPPLDEVQKALLDLMPPEDQQLSPEQRQQLSQLEKRQQQLQRDQSQLQQQMQQLQEKAPLFGPKLQEQMQKSGSLMREAQQSLAGREVGRGASKAGEAAQALEGLQQGMKQQGGGGGGGGLPMPSSGEGGEQQDGEGGQNSDEKVEIPEADPNRGPEAFRKDLMDAMKQGAPGRYEEQVRRYYEELVK